MKGEEFFFEAASPRGGGGAECCVCGGGGHLAAELWEVLVLRGLHGDGELCSHVARSLLQQISNRCNMTCKIQSKVWGRKHIP